MVFDHNLQYYCIKCGGQLSRTKTVLRGEKACTSQECLTCGYTLLYGTIKKKWKEKDEKDKE
jgi:uncharacterized Zn finger protein